MNTDIINKKKMPINQAFSARVKEILKEKKMTQYRLEQDIGMYHATMGDILNCKYKTANFVNMILIIQGLGISLSEFFDSPLFDFENLDIEEK